MRLTEADPSAPAAVEEALDEAVAPVVEQLKRLDNYIASREEELVSLRATRKRAARVLAAYDAERFPLREPGTSAQKKSGETRSSKDRDEKRARVEKYVRARPEEVVSVANINGDAALAGISRSMLGELLGELADRGVLRLDHVARGGSKQYRLIA
jgi:hypothetical protein